MTGSRPGLHTRSKVSEPLKHFALGVEHTLETLLKLRVISTHPDVLDNGLPDSLRDRLVVGPGDYLQRLGSSTGEPDGGSVCIHTIIITRLRMVVCPTPYRIVHSQGKINP